MKYLSVCSGIEAATQAWHPIGWQPVAFSEIDKFPAAVLAHHYPNVPNWGDMTNFKEWPDATVDVLVGGTPCQSFSVAGPRKGLADPRGNLALTYLAIAERYRPEWLVWENVPGVLSADGGRVFGAIIGGMVELGYCPAWRVLDAQYVRTLEFSGAVPQRRRRVFVVAHFGDWRRAAAVLFDAESLSGNSPPRRKTGQVAPTIPARSTGGGGLGTDFDCDGGVTPSHDVAQPLLAKHNSSHRADAESYVAHTLRGEGFDASEDGTGRGTPLIPEVAGCMPAAGATEKKHGHGWGQQELTSGYAIPVAFDCKGTEVQCSEGVNPPLRAMGHNHSHFNAGGHAAVAFDTTQVTSPNNYSNPKPGDPCHPLAAGAHPPAVAFDMRGREGGAMPEGPHDTANIRAADGGSSRSYVAQPMAVRRLTPRECERLQGFPDDFTKIPWRNKPADKCPDGPRYKALGNSMAVNVMSWIGQRIQMVSEMEGAA